MRAAAHRGLRLLPGGGHVRSREGPTTEWLFPTFVVLAIIAVLIAIVSGLSSERRAIRALPDDQRLAALSRTVAELRQFCRGGRTNGLEDHCRELASFAAQFDECRGECEALVRHQLTPAPRR